MTLAFCIGPENLDLELAGYGSRTNALARRFFERFKAQPDRVNWKGRLLAAGPAVPHLGTRTLELGPVSRDGELLYPELPGCPLRHGAPRAVLHGVMGLTAHFLRQRGDRLLHAAGRHLPNYGSVVAIGVSGAGKSTLTSVLGGDEMGDEGIALQWQDGELRAQACLVPGERLAECWEAKPLRALLLPTHNAGTTITPVYGHEALVALTNAIVRLRGDDIFEDFDWAHHALKQVTVLRVGWSLAHPPIEELKRALDASS